MSRTNQKLYIIHGWTYNLDKWQPILPMLKKAGFDPILLSVPGLTAPSDKVWTIDGYANWLQQELADEPKPLVVGHSNGGRIALRFENLHPGRLKGLVLIDAAGVPHQTSKSRAKIVVLRVMAKIGKPLKYVPIVRRVFYRLIGGQDYLNAPANMKKTMQNMLAANDLLDFAAVSVPTTLIWGSEDQQTPLADGKFMAQHIPGAQLHIIDEARHAPMYTHADQVAEIIEAALL